MAVKPVVQSTKERMKGTVTVTAIALVQVAWGAALVYLVVHFVW